MWLRTYVLPTLRDVELNPDSEGNLDSLEGGLESSPATSTAEGTRPVLAKLEP